MMHKKRLHKKNIRLLTGGKLNVRLHKAVFNAHDFSDIEDAKTAAGIINGLTIHAGKAAAISAKKAGLRRIFVRNNQLITINAKGDKQIIKKHPAKAKSFYIKYNPVTILHAAK